MKVQQVNELTLQAREHEPGGIDFHEKAVQRTLNRELREEWEKYLTGTRTHVQALTSACEAFGLHPMNKPPSRAVIRTARQGAVRGLCDGRGPGGQASLSHQG